MSDSDKEPNWNLIKSNPRQFFGLNERSDKRDLKRSYNRLLKRFKPEKYPDEFQKIRAAYEKLHEEFRYQTELDCEMPDDSEHLSSLRIDSMGIENEINSTFEQSDLPFDRSEDDYQTFAISDAFSELTIQNGTPDGERSVDNLYLKIKDFPRLDEEHFLALAALSDFTHHTKRETEKDHLGLEDDSFEGWILRGLSKFPTSYDLRDTCELLISRIGNNERCIQFLELAVRTLKSAHFFPFTASIWLRLVVDLPFDEFQQLLKRFKNRLGLDAGDEIPSFYLQLLKKAVWKADPSWLDEKLTFCESQIENRSYWEQSQLEEIHDLVEVVENRKEFSEQSETARLLIHAMESYYLAGNEVGDWHIIQFHHFVSKRGAYLSEDFYENLGSTIWGSSIVQAWYRCVSEVCERLEREDSTEISEKKKESLFRELMERLDKRYTHTNSYNYESLNTWAFLCIAFTACFSLTLSIGRYGYHAFAGELSKGLFLIPTICLTLVVGISLFILLGVLRKRFESKDDMYPTFRPELIAFIGAHSISPSELLESLPDDGQGNLGADELETLKECVKEDLTLEIAFLSRKLLIAAG